MIKKDSKIYVAGHTGMVGSALVRKFKEEGYQNIIARTPEELDLTNQQDVIDFFSVEKPDYVLIAAAKVGGIMANNTYRAQFIYENLMIQNNIIHQSFLYGVKKLLFLGSSCIYPKNCPQPIKEEYLLTGELEPTNEPYAIAKIAGIKMCENYYRQYGCNFISVMPTNLYGPNDNYDLSTSHVIPALIRKLHLGKCLENNFWNELRKDLDKRPIEGINGSSSENEILYILQKYGISMIEPSNITKGFRSESQSRNQDHVSIILWGTGQVYREFMHVDDMTAACLKIFEDVDISSLYCLPCKTENQRSNKAKFGGNTPGINNMKQSSITFLNIGTGVDQTIKDLVKIIRNIVGFEGEINFDSTKADGPLKKLLDISQLKTYGFEPFYTLDKGIEQVYKGYTNEH